MFTWCSFKIIVSIHADWSLCGNEGSVHVYTVYMWLLWIGISDLPFQISFCKLKADGRQDWLSNRPPLPFPKNAARIRQSGAGLHPLLASRPLGKTMVGTCWCLDPCNSAERAVVRSCTTSHHEDASVLSALQSNFYLSLRWQDFWQMIWYKDVLRCQGASSPVIRIDNAHFFFFSFDHTVYTSVIWGELIGICPFN